MKTIMQYLSFTWTIKTTASVLCICFFLTGCQPRRIDLLETGALRLERSPEKRGYYRDIHVYNDETTLFITGYVKRFLEPGRIEIEVFGSDGELLAETKVDVHRPMRSSSVRYARFEAQLTVQSEKASTVRITHYPSQI